MDYGDDGVINKQQKFMIILVSAEQSEDNELGGQNTQLDGKTQKSQKSATRWNQVEKEAEDEVGDQRKISCERSKKA